MQIQQQTKKIKPLPRPQMTTFLHLGIYDTFIDNWVKLNQANVQKYPQNIYAFLAQHQLQLNLIMTHSKSKEESQIEWETGSDLVLLIKIISLLQSINLNDRLGIKIEDRDKIINQEVRKSMFGNFPIKDLNPEFGQLVTITYLFWI